ncbi:MAG: YlxR family protein [Chloroflexi bacterium]|nr:MAG: YlxR family protein [Chloroflexota bacterium]
MGRQKHQPQRTCIACRQTKDKRELIRIVRTPEGQIIVDPSGKANGRGAYLCRRPECWDQGLRPKGRLAHALKTAISTRELEALKAALLALEPSGRP